MLPDIEQTLRDALQALHEAPSSSNATDRLRQAQHLCRQAEQEIEELIREIEAGGTLR